MSQITQEQLVELYNILHNLNEEQIAIGTLPSKFTRDGVACWKWAIYGLRNVIIYKNKLTNTVIHRPGEALSRISFETSVDDKSIWQQHINTLNFLNIEFKAFCNENNLVNPGNNDNIYIKWRKNVMQRIVNDAAMSAGLVPSENGKYTLFMNFADKTEDNRMFHGPNESHWWIKIPLNLQNPNGNYICIEAFPQDQMKGPLPPLPATLQFRYNSEYSTNNIISVKFNELQSEHVEII
jgi:hypothetical protein